MRYKLEPKPKHSTCPHCQSTETYISTYDNGRYCINCNKKYNRADEVRLREQRMEEDHSGMPTMGDHWFI